MTLLVDSNWLNDFFNVFKDFNIIRIYNQMPVFFEFIIYLTLFLGLMKITLQKQFPGKGGTAVIVSLGIALAIAMIFAGKKYNFSLKSLAPVSFMILLSYFILQILLLLKKRCC